MQERHDYSSLQGKPGFSWQLVARRKEEKKDGWQDSSSEGWQGGDAYFHGAHGARWHPQAWLPNILLEEMHGEIRMPAPPTSRHTKREFDLVLRAPLVKRKREAFGIRKQRLDLKWLWRSRDLKFSSFRALGRDSTTGCKMEANQSHAIKLARTAGKLEGKLKSLRDSKKDLFRDNANADRWYSY